MKNRHCKQLLNAAYVALLLMLSPHASALYGAQDTAKKASGSSFESGKRYGVYRSGPNEKKRSKKSAAGGATGGSFLSQFLSSGSNSGGSGGGGSSAGGISAGGGSAASGGSGSSAASSANSSGQATKSQGSVASIQADKSKNSQSANQSVNTAKSTSASGSGSSVPAPSSSGNQQMTGGTGGGGSNESLYQVLFGVTSANKTIANTPIAYLKGTDFCQKNKNLAQCDLKNNTAVDLFNFYYWARQLSHEPAPELTAAQNSAMLLSNINILNPSEVDANYAQNTIDMQWTQGNKLLGSSGYQGTGLLSNTLRAMVFPVVDPKAMSSNNSNPIAGASSVSHNIAYNSDVVSSEVKAALRSALANTQLKNTADRYINLRYAQMSMSSCAKNYYTTGTSQTQMNVQKAANMNTQASEYLMYQKSGNSYTATHNEPVCNAAWVPSSSNNSRHVRTDGNAFPAVYYSLKNSVTTVSNAENYMSSMIKNIQAGKLDRNYANTDVLKCMPSNVSQFARLPQMSQATILACQKANYTMLQLSDILADKKYKYEDKSGFYNSSTNVNKASENGKNFVDAAETQLIEVTKSLENLMVLQMYEILSASGKLAFPSYTQISGLPSYDNSKNVGFMRSSNQMVSTPVPAGDNIGLSNYLNLAGADSLTSLNTKSVVQLDNLLSNQADKMINVLSGMASIDSAFTPGILIPTDTAEKQIAVVSGGVYVLSKTGSDFYLSQPLSQSPKRYVGLPIKAADKTKNERMKFYANVQQSIESYENTQMQDIMGKSFTMGVMYDFVAERNTILETNKGVGVTPMQILVHAGTWRLNTDWPQYIEKASQENILREIAFMLAEQQSLITQQLIELKTLKFLNAISASHLPKSLSSMGGRSRIDDEIGNYIAGRMVNVNYMDPNSIKQSVQTSGAMKNANSMIGNAAAGSGASSDLMSQITTQSPSGSSGSSSGQ